MNNTMKAGIFAAVIVLFASLAMLAAPVSADGDGTETVEMKEMTAENFLALADKDGKIVMDSDVKLTSALAITGTIELDLAGHKLVNETAHTLKVADGGKLTVKGAGIVDCIKDDTAALYVDAGGEATLNGGTFTRSAETGSAPDAHGANSWYTIANRGTLTINEGVTVQNGDGETTGRFTSMIGNGYPTATDNKDGHDVTLTINGGNFVGGLWNLKNDDWGVMIINGGTFQASSGLSNILTWNNLTVKGGNFKSDVSSIVACDVAADYNDGLVTVTGGTFDCPNEIVALKKATGVYTVNIALDGIKEGRTVLKTYDGPAISGTVSVNKNAVELKDIKAGEGFALAVGSIDISGAYTSDADGSIIVKGEAKLSGTIDESVTVKVESGSITVPAGKTLTGTIQMGEKNSVAVSGITAGDNGLTVTPSTIGGGASAGAIAIEGTVSVASALNLGKDVTVTVPEKSELSVPKGASISGEGTVSNEGTLKVDGAVQSHVDNTGTVSAAVDAEIPDVDGEGTVSQPKPVIVKKTFDKEVKLGETVIIYVDVTEGADLKITGVSGATYKDGAIYWTPAEVDEWKITATPFIGDNIGESVTFTVNVTAAPEPVDPVEPEKEKKGGISAATILVIVILIALAVFAVTRVI